MLNVRRNISLLLCLFKRCIVNCADKENKHYEFFVRHIKTNLYNHSYILKQITAIPREIKCNISQGDIPNTNAPRTSYNTVFPSKNQSIFKITHDTRNRFMDKSVLLQDVVNKLVNHRTTKNLNSKKYIHGIFKEPITKKECFTYETLNHCAKIIQHRNDSENIKPNYQQNRLYSTQGDGETPYLFEPIIIAPSTSDSSNFSLNEIKELLNNKLKEIMISNVDKGNIISDDIVILNQKIPERESLLFFKNNDLHVMESSHTNFKKEVKKYIKKFDTKGTNRNAPERLNLIRFYKVRQSDNLGESNSFEIMGTTDSWESLNETTLKVKNSMPLENKNQKTWIEYDEDYNNAPTYREDHFEYGTPQNIREFSPKSGPPFTEKVPINKDKLIKEPVVPNTSILSIINSIDKSAVIIQKDLYITDQIIQKIQKEEEKEKEIDKNKLETSSKENYILYLGKPSIKDGMVTRSLAGVSIDNNKRSSNGKFYNKQSHIAKKKSKKINKLLQLQHLANKTKLDTSRTIRNKFNPNEYDSSGSMTPNGDIISLNMQYEPHKVVPMFLSNSQSVEQNSKAKIIDTSDIVSERTNESESGHSDIIESYLTSEDKFKNNVDYTHFQTSDSLNNSNGNRISEDSQSNLNRSNTKITFKEEPRYTIPYNYTLHTRKHINDSTRIISGKGSPVGAHANCSNSTTESRYNQLTNIKNNPQEYNENKSPTAVENIGTFSEGIPIDCFNKSNNSITKSQDENYKLLLMSNERIQKLENVLFKMIKLNESEKKMSSLRLSHVQKLLETLINYNSPKKDLALMDSNYQKNECEKKYPDISKQHVNHIAQRIVHAVSESVDSSTENMPKKYITVSNDLKNRSPVTIKNTRTFFDAIPTENINKPNNSRLNSSGENDKLLFMRNERIKKLENELSKLRKLNEPEKKNSDIPPKNADSTAQHLVRSFSESLETLLKGNILCNVTSVSDELKNESERNKNLGASLENHSNQAETETCVATPDFLNPEETILNVQFPKTETSVSKANFSNEGMLMGHRANLKNKITNSEDNNYKQYNTINNEKNFIENDYPKQSEIIHESEKKCSKICEEKLFSNAEPLPTDEAPNMNYGFFLNSSDTEPCLNNRKLPHENIQESNNKPRDNLTGRVNCKLYSLKGSNENCCNIPKISSTNEGSFKKNGAIMVSNINSSAKRSDVVPFKNYNDLNLSSISNTEMKQPPFMKCGDPNPPGFNCSSTTGKSLFSEKKTIENLYKFIPTKKTFEGPTKTKSSVDNVRKTTISSVEKNDFTDIKVSEIQTYVDSRLPIPFSTETFFQIFGSNQSLRNHSSFIDIAKYNLTSRKNFKDQESNLTVMAKLNDIHKSVEHLNFLALNLKSFQTKDALKNKALIPAKEEIKFSKPETPKKMKDLPINNKGSEVNFLPKFSLKIFNNNNLKNMNKPNRANKKKISEIKKKDQNISSKDEKGLLIVKLNTEGGKEIKMDQNKCGIRKPESTGIKVSKGKYVDLLSFNGNEKTQKPLVQCHKKGVYDHRGLSKRDRKILREITKEIPKKKSKGKSGRKRPIRPITSRKTEKGCAKSLPKITKDAEGKLMLPKKDKEQANKQILLPPGKKSPEKKVQKTFTNKIENKSHKSVSRVKKKLVENNNLIKSEGKKSQVTKADKASENIKISESNPTKAQKDNVLKLGSPKKNATTEKLSIKNIKNDGQNRISKKTLCQTYIATEAYINQPEKSQEMPEKIFTSKKILKKNPIPQKVTILENLKANKDANYEILKIHEGFKEDLIKKSQKKIENRTNIDFRVKTPKVKNLKSKEKTHKSKQKGKVSPIEARLNKGKNNSDIKNKHTVQKNNQNNKTMYANLNEIKTPKKAAVVQTMKKEELDKVKQSGQANKQTISQTNPKISERMAKITVKPQESQYIKKIFSPDKLESPTETKVNIKSPRNDQSEIINKKHFPMFLIDVDKMSKEIKPELDFKNCQKCQLPQEKITEFPLHNQEKKLLFKPPFKIMNLGPNSDPILRSELKLYPSVTKVLNSTIPEKSREILREWRKSMIDELGENGFKSFYKGELISGNKFNLQLHNYLMNGDQHKQESDILSLKSIENVFKKTSDLSAINSHVIHRKLAYRGVIDCVAKYGNKPVLIEWKRLENPLVEISESSIDVAATQLAAYVGAVNYDDTYKFQISGGLLVLAFNDGTEAEVIEIDNEQCNKYWKMWLKRIQLYHELSSKTSK